MVFNDTNKLRDDDETLEKMRAAGLTITKPNIDAFRTQVLKVFADSEYVQKAPAGWLDRIERLVK